MAIYLASGVCQTIEMHDFFGRKNPKEEVCLFLQKEKLRLQRQELCVHSNCMPKVMASSACQYPHCS